MIVPCVYWCVLLHLRNTLAVWQHLLGLLDALAAQGQLRPVRCLPSQRQGCDNTAGTAKCMKRMQGLQPYIYGIDCKGMGGYRTVSLFWWLTGDTLARWSHTSEMGWQHLVFFSDGTKPFKEGPRAMCQADKAMAEPALCCMRSWGSVQCFKHWPTGGQTAVLPTGRQC